MANIIFDSGKAKGASSTFTLNPGDIVTLRGFDLSQARSVFVTQLGQLVTILQDGTQFVLNNFGQALVDNPNLNFLRTESGEFLTYSQVIQSFMNSELTVEPALGPQSTSASAVRTSALGEGSDASENYDLGGPGVGFGEFKLSDAPVLSSDSGDDDQGVNQGDRSILITGNIPPSSNNASVSGTEDTTFAMNIPAPTDADSDDASLVITVVNLPNAAEGVITLGGVPLTAGQVLTPAQLTSLEFVPAANYNGTAKFDYSVSDGLDSTLSTHTITVTGVNDAPTFPNGATSITLDEDTSAALGLDVATDPDVIYGDILMTEITTPLASIPGTITLDGNPIVDGQRFTSEELSRLQFTPNQDYNGVINLDYTATDSEGISANNSHTITVNPVNDAPVANDSNSNQDEDTVDIALGIPLPTDVDGDALTVVINTLPTDGVLKFANGVVVGAGVSFDASELPGLTFTPNRDYNGTVTVDYTVSDGQLDTNATHTITVNPVNDDPVANDSTSTQDEDSVAVPLNIPAPTDVDGDVLTITVDAIPGNGELRIGTGTLVNIGDTLTVAQLQILTFTPDANYNGTLQFNYTVDDGNGGSDTATHTITVGNGNDAPVANDSTSSQDEDTSLVALNIPAPTDPDGDVLTITIDTLSSNGIFRLANGTAIGVGSVLTVDELTGLTFTPNPDYNGIANLNYTVDDGNGGTDTATHTITVNPVNDDPVANDSNSTQAEDSSLVALNIPAPTDVDGDTLTITIDALSSDGVFRLANGTAIGVGAKLSVDDLTGLTFTPNPDYNGSATLNYTVDDGNGGSDSATHTVTVTPVNDDPVANDSTSTQAEDSSLVALSIPAPTDVDGDVLTITIDTLSSNGVFRLANGTIVGVGATLTVAELQGLTFTPNPDYNGIANFNYTVDDGNGGTDTATHTITVTPVNDDPVANDSTSTQLEDSSLQPLNIPAPTDVDGDTLSITINSLSTDGVFRLANGTIVGVGAVLTVAELTGLTFTPSQDYNGTANLSYTVDDGNGGSDTATHTITVTPVNDDPVANDSNSTQAEDSVAIPLNIPSPTDVDGDVLTITINNIPANGELRIGTGTVVNNGDTLTVAQLQALTFTPDANYHGTVQLDYTVDDGNGGSDTATHTITVTDENTPPIVNDSTSTQPEDSSKVDLGIDAPVDPDGDALTITITDLPDNGTLRFENGMVVVNNTVITEAQLEGLTYTPNPDYNGSDSFTYSVSDGKTTQNATHTINVSSVLDDIVVKSGELIDNSNIVSIDGLLRAAEIEDCVATGSYQVDKAFPDNSIVAGTDYSYQIPAGTFSDPEGGTLTYSATYTINGVEYSIPTSGGDLNIDPRTGLITGKIPANFEGDFSITVRATSTTGKSGEKDIDYNLISLAEFSSIDVIGPRYGSYLLAKDFGNNIMVGVGGDDILRYDFLKGDKGIIADLNASTVDKQTGYVDTVNGYKEIVGTQHDDIIIAKDGETTNVNGYKGNDLIYSSSSGDKILGGDGFDTVSYENSTGAVNVDLLGRNTNWGYAQNDILGEVEGLIGSRYNDVLQGDNNNNVLDGNAGADKMYGHGGNDTFIVDRNDTLVDGGTGYDTVLITADNSMTNGHISFAKGYTIGPSVDLKAIEEINMANGVYNETVHITVKDLLVSSNDNIVRIKGDLVSDFKGAPTDDNVQIHDKSASQIRAADKGTITENGTRYDVYDFGSEGKLYVEYGLDIIDSTGNQV